MKCLVTGAAGFIGSHLTDYLVKQGHEVFALDNLEGGKRGYVNSEALFYLADLRIKWQTREVIRKTRPEIIFHLAAHACEGQSVFNPIYTVNSNLIGFLNLFTSALNIGFETFVFTSSMAVYGTGYSGYFGDIYHAINKKLTPWAPEIHKSLKKAFSYGFDEDSDRRDPVDPYGITKAAIERILEIYSKEFGFNYVIWRPHNVYGPRQNLSDPYRNVLGVWMNRIMQGKPPIIYGDGEQRRAFSYIDDCIPYMGDTRNKKAYGQIFNIGGDEVVTINEACKIVGKTMSDRYTYVNPIYVPARPLDVKNAWCSHGKAKEVLGYETKTSLVDGIQKMAKWAKKQGPQPFKYWSREFEITKKVPKVWSERQQ